MGKWRQFQEVQLTEDVIVFSTNIAAIRGVESFAGPTKMDASLIDQINAADITNQIR